MRRLLRAGSHGLHDMLGKAFRRKSLPLCLLKLSFVVTVGYSTKLVTMRGRNRTGAVPCPSRNSARTVQVEDVLAQGRLAPRKNCALPWVSVHSTRAYKSNLVFPLRLLGTYLEYRTPYGSCAFFATWVNLFEVHVPPHVLRFSCG